MQRGLVIEGKELGMNWIGAVSEGESRQWGRESVGAASVLATVVEASICGGRVALPATAGRRRGDGGGACGEEKGLGERGSRDRFR